MTLLPSYLKHAAAGLALLTGLSAQAASLDLNVSGIQSQGSFGDAGNTVLSLQLGAGAWLGSLSWDIELEAYAPSQLGDIRLALSDSALAAGLLFTPAEGMDQAGQTGHLHLQGSLDLAAEGQSFQLGSDGLLRLEFHQAASNGLGPDALWKSGTLSVATAPVPEPASLLMLAAGLGLLGLHRRRKQTSNCPTA